MSFFPLPDISLEPVVRQALAEDLGRAGDITTNATVAAHKKWEAAVVVRGKGVIAGMDLARLAFLMMDPSLKFEALCLDGERVKAKMVVARIKGNARAIITAERVALNFLCRMSGIATATCQLVDAVKPYKARICCTRKTAPGLRAIEKYAVRVGGGVNHRFGLDDAILIKDNHIAACGSIKKAVMQARQAVGHLVKIELEVDTLEQVQEALDLPLDAILLDNMSPRMLKKAVQRLKGRFTVEASGRVTVDTVRAIAASGVDVISVGWITHSAPILDMGLDA